MRKDELYVLQKSLQVQYDQLIFTGGQIREQKYNVSVILKVDSSSPSF